MCPKLPLVSDSPQHTHYMHDTLFLCNLVLILIGASPSKPHTSVTASSMCVFVSLFVWTNHFSWISNEHIQIFQILCVYSMHSEGQWRATVRVQCHIILGGWGLLQVSTTLGPEIQLMICLPHACMTIVAALTDSGESQTLLLSMFRVPWQ